MTDADTTGEDADLGSLSRAQGLDLAEITLRAELEQLRPVAEAARTYEAAWTRYASMEGGAAVTLTKARAHQAMLTAIRALNALDGGDR